MPVGNPNTTRNPTLGLQRHPNHPVPAQPRQQQPRRVGVFAQPIGSPTRRLTAPAPVRHYERKLPPAPMPSYPVLRHYTPRQQATVVRGTQRAGQRVADRGAIRQQALAPLAAVRNQQQRQASSTYARQFNQAHPGARMTPQQAGALRGQQSFQGSLSPKAPAPPSFLHRLVHALLTGDTGSYDPRRDPSVDPQAWLQQQVKRGYRSAAEFAFQPQSTPYDPLPPHVPYSGPLGLGTLGQSLQYEANVNTGIAKDFGQAVQQYLHAQAQKPGSGATPLGFLRAPALNLAAGIAPDASRLIAGAGNDVGQYVLGALPTAATLGQEALSNPRGAVGELLKGTLDIAKHPLDHPLFALQLLHGGVRGVSRTAGALGRSPLAPAAVRDAFSTRRTPLQIAGPAATRLLEYRHYSKDPLVKGLQVLSDRRLKDGARVLDQHGNRVQAKLAPTAELGGIRGSFRALHTSTLGRDTTARLRGHGDFVADRANAVERHNRAQIQRELVNLMPTREHRGGRAGQAVGGYLDRRLHSQPSGIARLPNRAYRPERDVIGLIIRGRVRGAATFRADLEAELHRLEARAGHSFDHPEQRAINLQNQESIRRTLADPRAMDPRNVRRLVDSARQLANRGRSLTRQAVAQGALSPEAAARAPLFDYALAHMGARYVHPDQHAALEQQALTHERAAAAHVHELQRTPKPLVHPNEIRGFTRHSVVKEPVYSVRSADTARNVQSFGLDPGRSRKGVFGAGTYVAVGKADRNYSGTAVAAHVDIRKPLVIHNDTAMAQTAHYREEAIRRVGGAGTEAQREAVAQEMTRLMRRDGYDAVIVKGAGKDGQDWVNVFDPGKVRVVAPKTTVRTGEISATAAEALAKQAGVRLASHEKQGLGTALELHGARDQAHVAAALIADHTGTPTRLMHEFESGTGAAYFAGGRLVAIEPHRSIETLNRLQARYGRTLEYRHGDAQDIHPGESAGVRAASESARSQATPRSAAGEPRPSGTHAEALASARQAHAAARARRIAVSGRDPALVDRHEQAVALASAAKRERKLAEAEHARAVQQRDRAAGAVPGFRDRRAIAHGERPTGRTVTATDRQLLASHDQAVERAAQRRRAAVQADRTARQAVPKRPDIVPALRNADGTLLTNEAIHAHMRANGIPFDRHGPQIAYLPDRPDVNSRASYHRAQALMRRDSVEQGFHRTGAAQEMGITGHSFNLVADHMVRMGITTGSGAIGQFDRVARETGIVAPDGRPFTGAGAELAMRNINAIPDQPKVVAVRLMPGRAGAAQRDLIQRIQNPEALDPTHYGTDFKTYVERSFAERVANADTPWLKDNSTRNVALMPEELVNRFQQHLSALGGRSPTGALLSKAFRTSVLPFSSKWLVGNVAEAVLRLGIIGANPVDYIAGRRVVSQARGRAADVPLRRGGTTVLGHKVLNELIGLDAQHAGLSTELGSSLLGGLLYGDAGLTVHRGVSDYEHSNMRVPAQVIGGLAHTTMLRELGHELNRIPQTIFHLNKFLEQQTQYTALGRYVRRDIHEFTGSYVQTLRLQKTAMAEAARGLYNTAAQRDAARFMDETLGKYSRFSPKLRALIQTATPFLPWYLNAARFVFWTLPMKHPAKTAVLMAAEQAFSKDWAAQHKDLPPGELKSAVKSGGGWLDLARFTPFGAATGALGGDPSTLVSPFFPQAQGIYHALSGQDPFGRQLQVPKTASNPKGIATNADIWKAVADQGLGSFVPGYAPGERVANHGETPYGNSSLLFGIHTKPGSSHGSSGLERWLNPVRPVYLHPRAGTAAGPPPGVSPREYQLMLREARSAAQAAPKPSSREQQMLLKEARQAAGVTH